MGEERVLRVSHAPSHGAAPSPPQFWGFSPNYAYTVCCRTTKFGGETCFVNIKNRMVISCPLKLQKYRRRFCWHKEFSVICIVGQNRSIRLNIKQGLQITFRNNIESGSKPELCTIPLFITSEDDTLNPYSTC